VGRRGGGESGGPASRHDDGTSDNNTDVGKYLKSEEEASKFENLCLPVVDRAYYRPMCV
jgi:hypothetical protein